MSSVHKHYGARADGAPGLKRTRYSKPVAAARTPAGRRPSRAVGGNASTANSDVHSELLARGEDLFRWSSRSLRSGRRAVPHASKADPLPGASPQVRLFEDEPLKHAKATEAPTNQMFPNLSKDLGDDGGTTRGKSSLDSNGPATAPATCQTKQAMGSPPGCAEIAGTGLTQFWEFVARQRAWPRGDKITADAASSSRVCAGARKALGMDIPEDPSVCTCAVFATQRWGLAHVPSLASAVAANADKNKVTSKRSPLSLAQVGGLLDLFAASEFGSRTSCAPSITSCLKSVLFEQSVVLPSSDKRVANDGVELTDGERRHAPATQTKSCLKPGSLGDHSSTVPAVERQDVDVPEKFSDPSPFVPPCVVRPHVAERKKLSDDTSAMPPPGVNQHAADAVQRRPDQRISAPQPAVRQHAAEGGKRHQTPKRVSFHPDVTSPRRSARQRRDNEDVSTKGEKNKAIQESTNSELEPVAQNDPDSGHRAQAYATDSCGHQGQNLLSAARLEPAELKALVVKGTHKRLGSRLQFKQVSLDTSLCSGKTRSESKAALRDAASLKTEREAPKRCEVNETKTHQSGNEQVKVRVKTDAAPLADERGMKSSRESSGSVRQGKLARYLEDQGSENVQSEAERTRRRSDARHNKIDTADSRSDRRGAEAVHDMHAGAKMEKVARAPAKTALACTSAASVTDRTNTKIIQNPSIKKRIGDRKRKHVGTQAMQDGAEKISKKQFIKKRDTCNATADSRPRFRIRQKQACEGPFTNKAVTELAGPEPGSKHQRKSRENPEEIPKMKRRRRESPPGTAAKSTPPCRREGPVCCVCQRPDPRAPLSCPDCTAALLSSTTPFNFIVGQLVWCRGFGPIWPARIESIGFHSSGDSQPYCVSFCGEKNGAWVGEDSLIVWHSRTRPTLKSIPERWRKRMIRALNEADSYHETQ